MKKTMVAIAAFAALAAGTSAFAQTAKAPAAPVEIPKGIFIEAQPKDAYLARDTVLFSKVHDATGKIIGDVEDLIVNDHNEIVGVILGTGGFLGAGEKKIAVRLSALEVTEKAGKLYVSLTPATRDIVKALPAFQRQKPAKSMLDRIKEKAQELTDKTLVTSQDAIEKARHDAAPALEKAKDAAGKAYDKAKDAAGQAYEKAKGAVEQKQ